MLCTYAPRSKLSQRQSTAGHVTADQAVEHKGQTRHERDEQRQQRMVHGAARVTATVINAVKDHGNPDVTSCTSS
jgi:hypothetical protein